MVGFFLGGIQPVLPIAPSFIQCGLANQRDRRLADLRCEREAGTSPISRALRRRVRDDRFDPRPRAEPLGARDVFGDVERALLVQVVADSPRSTALGRRSRARRTGGERGSRRRRRRRRRRRAHREPQSPVCRRAIPRGGNGSRRDPAGRVHDGCPAYRSHGPALHGRARRCHGVVGSSTVWCEASPATATRSASRPSAVSSRSLQCYRDNPLVNVLCLGVLPIERLVLASASGEGNLAVLLGSLTGRDGIGGVSVLASAGLGECR